MPNREKIYHQGVWSRAAALGLLDLVWAELETAAADGVDLTTGHPDTLATVLLSSEPLAQYRNQESFVADVIKVWQADQPTVTEVAEQPQSIWGKLRGLFNDGRT